MNSSYTGFAEFCDLNNNNSNLKKDSSNEVSNFLESMNKNLHKNKSKLSQNNNSIKDKSLTKYLDITDSKISNERLNENYIVENMNQLVKNSNSKIIKCNTDKDYDSNDLSNLNQESNVIPKIKKNKSINKNKLNPNEI